MKNILQKEQIISFEIYPPRSKETFQELIKNIYVLELLNPDFISVTTSKNKKFQYLTYDLVKYLVENTKLKIVPHITCLNSTENEIYTLLNAYEKLGIDSVIALRGDLPNIHEVPQNTLYFLHSIDLVEYIKQIFPNMVVGVAGYPEGHPEALNRLLDMRWLKKKSDAADFIITQMCFNSAIFDEFLDKCKYFNVQKPIIAGIMPIYQAVDLPKVLDLGKNIDIPCWYLEGINRNEKEDTLTMSFIYDCLNFFNIKGIHIYSMNQLNKLAGLCEKIKKF